MSHENSLSLPIIIILSFVCLLVVEADDNNSFRVDCGSHRNTTIGNRIFMGDNYASKYIDTPFTILANTSTKTNFQIYQTARIFNGTTTYKFPINQSGRYMLRLYFFSFTYNSFNLSNVKFSVTHGISMLFSNYTPTSDTIKEYSFHVESNEFEIIIEPNMNSFAYLNALEIFLLPNELIQDEVTLINSKKAFKGLSSMALETVFRVNMGGKTINYNNDTLWRTWASDVRFLEQNNFATNVQKMSAVRYKDDLATKNVAPIGVYGSCTRFNPQYISNANFNLTWSFDIDIGFQYLVRFHYCDIVSKSTYKLYFNVYVDAWIISSPLDLSYLTNDSLGVPIFMDYITPVAKHNKMDISISPIGGAHRNNPEAILNGLEIMKLDNFKDAFDEGSKGPQGTNLPPIKKSPKSPLIVIVGAILVFVLLFVVSFFIFIRNNHQYSTTINNNSNSIVTNVVSNNGNYVSLLAILAATNNFDDSSLVGEGGFGKVYRGVLADGTKIAAKRGFVRSQHHLHAFRNEIEMLSRFRHNNLVSLIGYCDENNENIIIYEYMENGTLQSHLYDAKNPSLKKHPGLSWKKRLEICIDAARGIEYLHNGLKIIHRDIKSLNILLDENMVAKIADFGLSKARTRLDQTHVTTLLKGSVGYIDPEYVRSYRITDKSDVYSFGVVLFEVLCARKVNDQDLQGTELNLTEWALKWHNKGEIVKIIDPVLHGKIKPESLRTYANLAERCVSQNHYDRPTMSHVMSELELALHHQEAPDPNDDPQRHGKSVIVHTSEAATTSSHNRRTSDEDIASLTFSQVFSEMLKTDDNQ